MAAIDAANWPTATATNRVRNEETLAKCAAFRKRNANQNTVPLYLEEVVLREEQHGQAAPASSSSHGSRPESSEQSQRNWQTFAHGTHNRGETPHRQVVKALVNGEKAQTQCLTVDQVFAEEIKGTNPKLWRTPSVAEEKNQNTSAQIYLQNQVGATPKVWRTPSSSDGEGGVMEMREGCAGKYKLRDHVVAEQKQWATPKASDPQHSGPNIRDSAGNYALPAQAVRENWATPIMGDSHLASTPEVAQKRIEEGKVTLSRQTAAWATPQLQDGHNINQDSTTHKTIPAQLTKMNAAGKLNPRWVETLMGLPVGWTMPSCKSPVTIEPTNCASSAMESCQPPPSEHFEF
jgi:hypothetical protein